MCSRKEGETYDVHRCAGQTNFRIVRLEVLIPMKMSLLFFWFIMPCGLVGRYQSSPYDFTIQKNTDNYKF